MYKFSTRSINNLRSCDTRLREVANAAICIYDFTVIDGARTYKEQEILVEEKLSWSLDSPHVVDSKNIFSYAIDIVPYPFHEADWDNREKFCYMGGIVMGIAYKLGIDLVWGGDWRNTKDPTRNSKFDGGHFEIKNWRSQKILKCST